MADEPVNSGAPKYPGRPGRPAKQKLSASVAIVPKRVPTRHQTVVRDKETFATQKRRLSVPDWKRFSRMLSAATDKGRVLCDFAMEVLSGVAPDGEKYDVRYRMDALKFIAERMYGRVRGEVEISGPGGGPIPIASTQIDLSKCSDEELAALERVLTQATVNVIDAELSDDSDGPDESSESDTGGEGST